MFLFQHLFENTVFSFKELCLFMEVLRDLDITFRVIKWQYKWKLRLEANCENWNLLQTSNS